VNIRSHHQKYLREESNQAVLLVEYTDEYIAEYCGKTALAIALQFQNG